VKLYPPADLERFLAAVDSALTRQVDVIVIGGAAAALHYGVQQATRDVDTWTVVQDDLRAAVEQAHRVTGIDVPFGKSGVADAPWEFESRLERALPDLRRLIIRVPERHDLVLMKTIRGDEHDLEAIEAMHGVVSLSLDTLLARFEDEMSHVVSSPRMLRLNFLTLVERLFPRDLKRVAKRLG